MLKNNWRPVPGHLKRNQPALAQRSMFAKTVERGKVTIRECDIQFFHPRPVLERAGGNAFLHPDRDVSIERGEKAEAAVLVARVQNNLIELSYYFVDRLRRHG